MSYGGDGKTEMTPGGVTAVMTLLLVLQILGCRPQQPGAEWVRAFGYAPGQVMAIEVGDFGYPYVPVRVESKQLMLAFDTGNMVGVRVSSSMFDEIGLTAADAWTFFNSAGEPVSRLRVANGVEVSAFRRDLGPTQVSELDHPSLPGLVGPAVLGGGHFTLDYRARMMAWSEAELPDRVPGFRAVPLVRSSRHPLLVLVRGTIEGRTVLMELDTGKSRSVVNPALASELGLERQPRGVSIRTLRIGDLSFGVPSAKEVDQTGIDPDLPEPVLVGVGSDVLSRFVWTVDYNAGVLWVPTPGPNVSYEKMAPVHSADCLHA